MHILQLCKKFPYPLKDGESIAISALAKAYRALGHDIDMLAMNTSKHWFDVTKKPAALNHYTNIETAEIDNHIHPLEALRYIFSEKSYHIARFIDKGFEAKLKALLQSKDYDVIQLETLYLAPYIPTIRKYSKAVVAMRAHNVEHEIWERIASNSGNRLKKWYLQRITPRLKAFELEQLNQYDIMVGISERDVAAFQDLGLQKPALSVPIGIDSHRYAPDWESYKNEFSLSFIGSLDWMPNIEGLQWFLNQVWQSKLLPRFPDLKLHIAGRNTPDWLRKANYQNVIIHGEVDCAQTFINKHSVMIAPLLSGSGMRAKILEAMALGKVSISTRVGLEGIDAQHKKEVFFADTAKDYVQAITWCIEQGSTLESIGRAARDFAIANFDTLEIAKKVLNRYTELLNTNQKVAGWIR